MTASPKDRPPTEPGAWRWRLLALTLIVAVAGLRLAYLTHDCPLDLAPDEAHYWDWSRHLDWSYYSKGPLVAYLIRAGCLVAGPWAEQLTGTQMPAVRLPAVLCGSLLLWGVYVLTARVFRSERLAAGTVALGLTLPLVSAGSSLMTIDAPYACCWTWALVAGHQAVFRRSAWAWPAAGLLVGVGILAKYTMILWVPSLALFLLTSREHRRLLARPGFWVMAGVGAACCLPILVWNVQHDWVSLRHVGGQAGFQQPSGIRWLGPLGYLGTQCGLLLGVWFFVWLGAMVAHRPWQEADAGRRYLWWLSAPMFAFFLAFSLRTAEEPNWPVTAYISGLVLASGWLVAQLRSVQSWRRRLAGGSMACAAALGLAVTWAMHHTPQMQPVLLSVSGPATPQRPLPLRRFDPTCRLRGWRTLAAEVDKIREELVAKGIDPVLVGTGWNLPGELAFYCDGHPTVYSVGLAFGDRRSQYDFWRPNPVWDPEAFRGRTLLIVGSASEEFFAAFRWLELPPRLVVHREQGQPVAEWYVTVCHGFQGFPPRGDGPRY